MVTPLRAGSPGGKTIPERELIEHPTAPLILVSGGPVRTGDMFFSVDQQMEEFFRESYEKSPAVRLAVNEIRVTLEDAERTKTKRGTVKRRTKKYTSRKRPEVPKPRGLQHIPLAERRVFHVPQDIEWAESLYEKKPFFRSQLSADAFRYVIFGHTHGALEKQLTNGALYLNTGTWTTNEQGLPVVVAERVPGGSPTAQLRWFKGNQLI